MNTKCMNVTKSVDCRKKYGILSTMNRLWADGMMRTWTPDLEDFEEASGTFRSRDTICGRGNHQRYCSFNKTRFGVIMGFLQNIFYSSGLAFCCCFFIVTWKSFFATFFRRSIYSLTEIWWSRWSAVWEPNSTKTISQKVLKSSCSQIVLRYGISYL